MLPSFFVYTRWYVYQRVFSFKSFLLNLCIIKTYSSSVKAMNSVVDKYVDPFWRPKKQQGCFSSKIAKLFSIGIVGQYNWISP